MTYMTIEPVLTLQPTIDIEGTTHLVNIKEYESFLKQCRQFMDADAEGMQVMTQIISDQLIDSAKDSTKIAELRPQLKFLRELGFFLQVMTSPAD
jgi:hypothetical protein